MLCKQILSTQTNTRHLVLITAIFKSPQQKKRSIRRRLSRLFQTPHNNQLSVVGVTDRQTVAPLDVVEPIAIANLRTPMMPASHLLML